MAGKSKNRRKNTNNHNNNSHNNNSNNHHKLTEQQMCELIQQATQIHTLLDNRQESIKKIEQGYVYLISTKWLKQWKQYVGYDSLFSVEQASDNNDKDSDKKYEPKFNKKMGNKKPGRINSNLLINPQNQSDYFQVPQQLMEYQFLNQVIQDKLDMHDDYVSASQQLWAKLTDIYGEAQQIKRPLRINKSGKPYVDGALQKCDFIFINYNEQQFIDGIVALKKPKNLDDIVPCKKMQYSELWQLSSLYEFIRKYCLVLYNTEEVTIWLGENFVGSKTLQQMFVDSVKNQTFELYARKLKQDDQKYEDVDLDNILKEQQYTLIVQVGNSKIVTAELPEEMHGYCQQCIQKKPLVYHCQCNTMHYCSEQCRVDDQVWHFKLCDEAYDSEDDQQYQKKKYSKKLPVCGLKNLGNTCYMNSSIQLFLSIDFLVQMLGSNKYKKMISKEEDNAEMFLSKLSKFIKKFDEQKKFQVVTPWSLKAQVNYFMTPFKGYKQHDALDFITGFLNTINQCLDKKQKQEAYHDLFKNNMMGRYDSLVICPDCGMQVKNLQNFMQISLPIKPKTNKVLFSYVIFDGPLKYTYGKAQVYPSWKQTFSRMGFKNQLPTMVYNGKEGEQILSEVDTNADAEKVLKKMKKDLLIYPSQSINSENDLILNVCFQTTKNVIGQIMRASYSYPFPIIVAQNSTSAHLIMKLIQKVCPQKQQIYGQKFIYFQKKYDQIAQLLENALKIQSQQTFEQEQCNKQLYKLTEEFKQYLQDMKIKFYIEDLKKIKNICFYCHKKCQGCDLSPDFTVKCHQLFSHKVKQTKIMVQLPQKPEFIKQKIDFADYGDSKLQECLALFNEPEQLDEENAWYCSQCQDMRLAFKQMHINHFPKYLLIQLNRFKNGANGKVKNNQPIAYGQYERFGDKKYQLLAVIVHQGSIQGGHYWAICYRTDGYYIFNDQKVSKTEKICNKNAYILLYHQVDQQNLEMQQK